ncbi:hypothetical protein JVT61DRAFT_11061 [Boletus reticuloceps]|uniref:Uncharacterized protein n=1 Tax=Boletus reticuloceps TaxID=495285 RepID=A0A8I2YET5_9AGAM|nr:hypothetical protein JVT61DRAFT_11061 [Boletus reticuloceps]
MEPPPVANLNHVSGPEDLVMNTRKLCWMYSRCPQLLSLFSCLHYFKNIPVVPSDGSFTIYPDVVMKWLKLDRLLMQVLGALPINCPRNVILSPVPSDLWYMAMFQTEANARTARMCTLYVF